MQIECTIKVVNYQNCTLHKNNPRIIYDYYTCELNVLMKHIRITMLCRLVRKSTIVNFKHLGSRVSYDLLKLKPKQDTFLKRNP